MRFSIFAKTHFCARFSMMSALSLLAGCAAVSVTPEPIQFPDPSQAMHAIEAEPTPPSQVVVRDFSFAPSSVTENKSLLHRGTDLLRRSSALQRREIIGYKAAASLSRETAKRLTKIGLPATTVAADSDMSLPNNILMVTGALTDVDEGNRLTRIWVGLGAGKSYLDTQVHVFRVVNGEKAEVLAFKTHADSGEMPGLAASVGFGELFLAPLTALAAVKDAASGGEKIYVSQVNYLASKTADQIADYLSQYAAEEGWIPRDKAKSVHLAGERGWTTLWLKNG
jgi:hypothetical protein